MFIFLNTTAIKSRSMKMYNLYEKVKCVLTDILRIKRLNRKTSLQKLFQ